MEPVAVFTDPTIRPDYVREFVLVFWHMWGLRSVLLYPFKGASPLRVGEANAIIAHPAVADTYRADLTDLPSTARALGTRYEVVAVVPQAERQVVCAARLATLMDVGWMAPEVMELFRDKFRLKQSLRDHPGAPPVSQSRLVKSADEALAFVREHSLDRYVLKPNDGSGNTSIAFFDAHSDAGDVARYLADHQLQDTVLEEYLSGDEYCVNGQVDDAGQVTTYSVQRTVYTSGNGRSNLAGGFRMMQHSSAPFQTAAEYADRVLTTVGLARSPFHMEIKISPDGPQLVEVAARLGGAGIPFDTALAHSGRVNLFVEAARHYSGLSAPEARLDWADYDSMSIGTFLGVAHARGRVVDLTGARRVEQMPGFAHWVVPPQLGQRLRPTVDLPSSPWQVTMSAPNELALREAETQVREAMAGNRSSGDSGGTVDRLKALAAWSWRREPAVRAALTTRPHRLRVMPTSREASMPDLS
jgi:glutathione synthase/RimK-type ligase-like ATP-grasp enzyme